MPVDLEGSSVTNVWYTSVSDMTILVIATPVMILFSINGAQELLQVNTEKKYLLDKVALSWSSVADVVTCSSIVY